MSRHVFIGDAEAVAEASPGGVFEFSGAEARHAAVVKRISVGEVIDVVDGAGRRLTGTVLGTGAAAVRLRVDEVLDEPPPKQRIILVQALAKGDRAELAVEAATELGVDEVIPWQAERSIVRWRGDRADKGAVKWRATVTAAAKQSRRATIPPVHPVMESKALARWIAGTDTVIVLHEDAAVPLTRLLAAGNPTPRKPAPAHPASTAPAVIGVIVGPEGGISDRELDLFREQGARTAVLGPNILRASTAGPAAISVISQLTGRWDVS